MWTIIHIRGRNKVYLSLLMGVFLEGKLKVVSAYM